ncbi:MAG: TolB family protein [bacterium]
MAESPTDVKTDSVPPPKSPGFAEKLLNALKRFGSGLFAFLSTPVMAVIGFAIILLTWATVYSQKHFFLLPKLPESLSQNVASWPFLLTGIGLWFIARSRGMVANAYAREAKKNPQVAHLWKIPLIQAQSFFLYVLFIYAIGVGLNLISKIQGTLPLLLLFLLFLAYLLWYVIAFFINRFPQVAGLRIAFLALILGILSVFVMNFVLIAGLILAFFALLTVMVSILVVPFSAPEGRVWIRALCLLGTIGLLIPTAYSFLFGGGNQFNLVELNSALKGLTGEIAAVAYSPDGKELAFSIKKDQWYLELFTPGDLKNPLLKFPEGEDPFTPVFVENGKCILSDIGGDGTRNLCLTNPGARDQTVLTESGVKKTDDGYPWSEKHGEFLYVTHQGSHDVLKTLAPVGKKFKTILRSSEAIRCPSWTDDSKKITYLSGTGTKTSIHIYTLANHKDRKLLLAGANREAPVLPSEMKPQKFTLKKLIPAPDGFRYLYVTQEGKHSAIWTIHPDGSKESRLYQTFHSIGKVSWTPNAQSILFEEQSNGLSLSGGARKVKLLNANLSTVQNLILPQISDWDPTPSPNGADVAFVCNENLWYPSYNRLGIWIGSLR